MESNCGNCLFFRRNVALQPIGKCRFNPPVTHVIGTTQHPQTRHQVPHVGTYFPELPDTEWCGAYSRRQPKQVAMAQINLERLNIGELEGSA
jgi:hypothetical protein